MKPRTRLVLSVLTALAALIISGVALGQEGGGRAPDPAAESATTFSSGFTYQGQLEKSGSLVDGNCDFEFSLYSAANGGTQLGSTQGAGNVSVQDGRFTVVLNAGGEFGSNAFNGDDRWLQIAVRCPAGSGAYTSLSPRQQLTAAPYAIDADKLDNHDASYFAASGHDHLGQTWSATDEPLVITGTYDLLTTNTLPYIDPFGTEGAPLVLGNGLSEITCTGPPDNPCDGGAALRVITGTYGIYIDDAGTSGIYVQKSRGSGLSIADAGGSSGLYVGDALYYGITGNSTMAADECCYPVGVEGYGYNYSTSGGTTAYGLYGYAYRDGTTGGGQARGVYGTAAAVNGATAWAGYFAGDVNVTGIVASVAAGSKMDNPVDPANQYLYHAAVESSDMLNIYSGNVILDENGEAWVDLPAWFEALNKEFRYQLTPIGAPGPSLYIAEKIQDNRFKIGGGEPAMEVSWQVTGIRNDPYAQDHRFPVEQVKPEAERGTYLYPQGYGMPEEMGLEAKQRAEMEAQRQQARSGQEAVDEPQP